MRRVKLPDENAAFCPWYAAESIGTAEARCEGYKEAARSVTAQVVSASLYISTKQFPPVLCSCSESCLLESQVYQRGSYVVPNPGLSAVAALEIPRF